MLKEHGDLTHAAVRLTDLASITLSAWLAAHAYLHWPSLPDHYNLLILLVLLLSLTVFPLFSVYQIWRGGSLAAELRNIGLAWLAVGLIMVGGIFLTKTAEYFSRGWILYWLVFGWVGLTAERALLRGVLRFLRRHNVNLRHIVLAGNAAQVDEITQRIEQSPWAGFRVQGYFGPSGATTMHLGDYDKLADHVGQQHTDQVWIALPLREEEQVQHIMHDLRHHTVDIRWLPDISGFRLINHSVTEVAGLPALNLAASPMVGVNLVLKALEDRVISALILLMISPIMLLLALGVKLSSPGPVFYRQERVGFNNKPFLMLKFRSMPVDVEKNGVQWGGAQNKTTSQFGAFIRKTSLDELPQFLNVLKGDMSIVGPRPERPIFVDKFKDEIPDYMKKHLVKAGITGWAQINGWRGDTDLNKRIEYDLYYIENWSLWFDLRIIFLTLFKGFVHQNAK